MGGSAIITPSFLHFCDSVSKVREIDKCLELERQIKQSVGSEPIRSVVGAE
jgi:hypothetical protein